jgi:hypothetical protein
LNVHRIGDVRQIEIHTAQPLIPEPRPFEFEIFIAELKKYKSPNSDRISAEVIHAGGETLPSEVHNLVLFGVRRIFLSI